MCFPGFLIVSLLSSTSRAPLPGVKGLFSSTPFLPIPSGFPLPQHRSEGESSSPRNPSLSPSREGRESSIQLEFAPSQLQWKGRSEGEEEEGSQE